MMILGYLVGVLGSDSLRVGCDDEKAAARALRDEADQGNC